MEFVSTLPLPQAFHLKIMHALALLIAFQYQRPQNRLQRFAVLRKIVELGVHGCAYYRRKAWESLRAISLSLFSLLILV